MSAPERSISSVLQDILGNFQEVVRSEVRLAKTEVREELAKTRSAGGLIAVGAVGALFSVLFMLLTAVYALSLVMAEWAAALCVAAAVGVLAVFAILAGVKRFKTINPTAPKTVASLKENVEWAKQQIK